VQTLVVAALRLGLSFGSAAGKDGPDEAWGAAMTAACELEAAVQALAEASRIGGDAAGPSSTAGQDREEEEGGGGVVAPGSLPSELVPEELASVAWVCRYVCKVLPVMVWWAAKSLPKKKKKGKGKGKGKGGAQDVGGGQERETVRDQASLALAQAAGKAQEVLAALQGRTRALTGDAEAVLAVCKVDEACVACVHLDALAAHAAHVAAQQQRCAAALCGHIQACISTLESLRL
jgi:hypothetical protein